MPHTCTIFCRSTVENAIIYLPSMRKYWPVRSCDMTQGIPACRTVVCVHVLMFLALPVCVIGPVFYPRSWMGLMHRCTLTSALISGGGLISASNISSAD